MVLRAYVDDSSNDGHSLILAGYISTAAQWAAFADEWEIQLRQRPFWRRFKMSEIMNDSRDPWPDQAVQERVVSHYRIIEKYIVAGVCVAVPCASLAKVVKCLGIPKQLANPYYLAWRTLIAMCHQRQRSMGFDEQINFTFDDQSEGRKLLVAWDEFASNFPNELKPFVGNTPIFGSDDKFTPLQAADLFAWWMAKRYRQRGTILIDEFPFPWQQSREGPPALAGRVGRNWHLSSANQGQGRGYSEVWRLGLSNFAWRTMLSEAWLNASGFSSASTLRAMLIKRLGLLGVILGS